tara:strand:- start:1214 stop:3004 length:1791 start_codon:yes stop_codon:yes gene_type:complete
MSKTNNPVKKKIYVVAVGKTPGIYENWQDAKDQIDGFSGALYKSFTCIEKANEYYQQNIPLSPETPIQEEGVNSEYGDESFWDFDGTPFPEKIGYRSQERSIPTDTLSDSQQTAIKKFKQGKNLFITGPGGSGKSFLIQTMIKIGEKNQKNVDVCALTGCAALLLGGGSKTIHSWAGIGLAKEPNQIIATKIDLNSRKKRNWRKVDILIIDEISMMSKKIFELLDMIAKKVRKNSLPFGGIQVVFSGDFFQLPPIINNQDEEEGYSGFCFESELWNTIFDIDCQVEFTKIFRQKDAKYAKILNQIRKGSLSRTSYETLKERVNYPRDEDNSIIPTILLPRKNMVEEINKKSLANLQGEQNEYKIEKCTEVDFALSEKEKYLYQASSATSREFEYKNLMNNVNCEHNLILKIGSQVMCTVNLDLNGEHRICNGSLGIVTKYGFDGTPFVKFANGVERPITKHIWKSEQIPGVGVKQIPLMLAWAITIHKSQGATLDLAEIDVGSNIFESGQTYVALSRVKELSGLYLKSFNPQKIKVNKKVKKFYEELNLKQKENQTSTTSNAFDVLLVGSNRSISNPINLADNPRTGCDPPRPKTT